MKKLVALLLSVPALLISQSSIPKDARAGYEWITPKNLKSHLSVLASDSLEGRETSFPGQRKAAQYLADRFQRAGLTHPASHRSFFQTFSVELTKTSEASSLTVSDGGTAATFRWMSDYISFGGPDTTVAGAAVFVGYMDARFDSSTSARLAGRVVIALAGSRSGPRDTSSTSLRRRLMQMRADKGSLATLVVGDSIGAGSFPRFAPLLRSMVEKGSMRIKGQEARRASFQSLYYMVSDDLARALLQSTGRSLAELRTLAHDSAFAPLFLDRVSIRITHSIIHETRQTENVIAVLEGSDPTLKEEYVFFTAHYDHLGRSSDGSIYRGADDDGSGTAAVAALAEAFSRNKVRPKRSLVFLAVTGEEKGLLGSSYYTANPLLPLDRTMVDLNIDMIGRSDPKHDSLKSGPYVYVIGADKISTELDQLLIQTNRATERIQLDYQYNDENDPNQFYRRSDHYNFAKNGVPITFFFTGEHADYHRTTDTIDKIRFDEMAKIVRLIYATGWQAANRPEMFAKDGDARGYK